MTQAGKLAWWRRFLRLHMQHNGFVVLQRYYERHFTPVGKALLLLLMVSLSLGMVGTEVLIYVFLCAQAALWFGTILVGWLSRPRRLSARVLWPGRLQAGEKALCELVLENTGPQPVFHLFTEVLLTGPGQQGLVLRPHGEIFCLDGGQRGSHRFEWTPLRRGAWKLLEVQFISMFPLGIALWRQRQSHQQTVWVYPRLLPIGEAPWRRHHPQLQQLTSQATLLRGNSLEFQGIRPWLPGDSPRFIHWPSLARSGQLTVREYQESPGHQLGLLLQTGHGETPEFEAAVSLMAGLVQELAGQPLHQPMLAQFGQSLSLALHSPLIPDQLMLQLAQVSGGEPFELSQLWETLLHVPAPTLLICLATRWDEQLAHLQQQCQLRRVPLEILAVSGDPQSWAESGALVRHLDPNLWRRS